MVERVLSKRRRVMKEFAIDELSSVDRPAQAHATKTLMKRADDVEKKYKSISELPSSVKDNIPTAAQHQFMAVANSVLSGGGTDQSAFQQAWGALKNAGWSKNKDGKWVKKTATDAELDAAVLGKAAAMQTDAGTKFPASDFAYAPDSNKPSEWKLRLTASPGGAPDPAFVGAAAAALSPGGHRGKKVQLPAAAVAGVKAKVRAAWRKANPDKDPKDMPASIKKDYGDMSSMPMTVSQDVQAVDFDTVLAEQEAGEVADDIGCELREKWCALQASFRTIAADSSVSAQDKITQMQQSLQQFIDSLSEQSQEIADSMTKSLTEAAPSLADLLEKSGSPEGDDDMPADVKKQLDELQKSVAEITEKLAAATAADETKKAEGLQKQLDEANAKLRVLEKAETSDEAVAALAKAAGVALSKDAPVAEQVAELLAKAAMSDAEKQYFAGLSGKAKMDFMSASSADRAKMMSKALEADAEVYKAADGTVFRKSDDPRLVAMAKRADESEKIAKAEREKRETTELTKRAEETLKLYSDDVAKLGDKVEVLRAIDKIEDEGVRKAALGMLEVGSKAIEAAFKSIGHQDEKVRKSAEDFNKRVSEIAARDKISKAAAMRKARTECPEEYAAYQGTEKAN